MNKVIVNREQQRHTDRPGSGSLVCAAVQCDQDRIAVGASVYVPSQCSM